MPGAELPIGLVVAHFERMIDALADPADLKCDHLPVALEERYPENAATRKMHRLAQIELKHSLATEHTRSGFALPGYVSSIADTFPF